MSECIASVYDCILISANISSDARRSSLHTELVRPPFLLLLHPHGTVYTC